MPFFVYLAKVFIISGILLGYYWLFLRNKRFHHYNRFYLLVVFLLSFILPFIRIPLFYQPESPVNRVVYQAVDVLTTDNWENETAGSGNSFAGRLISLENGILLLYMGGILLLMIVLVRSLLYIRKISKRYPCEKVDSLKFYNTREPGTPFSFFRSVFWNDQLDFNSREGQQIFRHELFHVRQHHSADLLLAEIITTVFWFNPFFHIARKELKAIHEFLADQYAMSGSDRYAYAELLIQQSMNAKNVSISNHFFQNHIKRRIAMITQFNQSRYGYWSRLMILPVSLLLFCAVSLYAQQSVHPSEPFKAALSKNLVNVVIDAGHGGIDAGAQSYDGQIREKDITLQIAKKIQQLAPDYTINVALTRNGDYLPGEAKDTKEGLKNRTDFIEMVRGDLFISLHVSAAPKVKKDNIESPNPAGGIELFISNNNEKTLASSKQLGASIISSLGNFYAINPALLQRKENGIWVLDKSSCPAVLIECGYLTNDKDAAFFTKSKNQEELAKKILEGIIVYAAKNLKKDNASADYNQDKNDQIVQDTAVKTGPEALKYMQEQLYRQIKEGTWTKVLPVSRIKGSGNRVIRDTIKPTTDKYVVIRDTIKVKATVNTKIKTTVDTKVNTNVKVKLDTFKVIRDTIVVKQDKTSAKLPPNGIISVAQFWQLINDKGRFTGEISYADNFVKIIMDQKRTYYIKRDEFENAGMRIQKTATN